MVRLAAYGTASCALAGYVVFSAFRQRSNFFSAAVYLSKSNACMLILWNMGVFLTILLGRALQSLFFGPLRLLEVERLHERAWYAVTESLLALTIFRDEFDTSFVILFVSLLFFKVFHWLAADRVEMMEQSPSISRGFYVRMTALLSLLLVVDLGLILFAATTIMTDGPSVMIMFASEYMVLQATLIGICCKFLVNWYDLRSDIPWENKSVYIFYIDLTVDFVKLATYLGFFGLILTFYGLPLNILRDVYITARSFVLKIRDLSRYRAATRNMDERYPNASEEDMERAADKTCIICREDMEIRNAPTAGAPARPTAQAVASGRQGPNDTPKKLPCGHIFHFHCLRSWLERQQSCPTCRRNVIASSGPPRPANQAGNPGDNPPPAQPGAMPRPSGLAVPGQAGNTTASRIADPSRSSSRAPQHRSTPDNPLVAFQVPITSAPASLSNPTSPRISGKPSPTPVQPSADDANRQRRERMVAAIHSRHSQPTLTSQTDGSAPANSLSSKSLQPSVLQLKSAIASEDLREAHQRAAMSSSTGVWTSIESSPKANGPVAKERQQKSRSRSPPLMPSSATLQSDSSPVSLMQPAMALTSEQQADMPRLIPMYGANGSSFASELLRFSNDGQVGPSARMQVSPLPNGLNNQQLEVIDRVTKEALDSRLQILQSTQAALYACTQQLQQAMSALNAGDISAVTQIASEINASNRDLAAAQATQSKEKGREVAEQALPP